MSTIEPKHKIRITVKKNNTSLKFIDLFCGIGGFHQALTNLGFECVFACDIDDKCRDTYSKNYGILPEKDIYDIDISSIKPFEILCGGFPCQPFSKAGAQLGFDDRRGNLFFKMCEIIKYHMPKYILLENVRNLASHDKGNTWKVIKKTLVELGYNTYDLPVILNTLHFNIPQNRERVIIMCKRADLGDLEPMPKIPKNPKGALTNVLKNLIETDDQVDQKYNLHGKLKDTQIIWDNFVKILINNDIQIPKFPIWTDWWDNEITDTSFYEKYTTWIDKNRQFYDENIDVLKTWLDESRSCPTWKGAVRKFEWQAGDLNDNDGMNTVLWTSRGSGIRVKRCDYTPTLVAMAMIPVYGPKDRSLTPRELLRLQSFPDSFQYEEKYILKQVGNSVNVKMIECCAGFLILNKQLLK
jgi:DNA (cytosine-5)-methyltransferase 1